MSQYMHFFLKTNNDIFYPIATFNRSNTIYTMFERYAPAYEEVSALDRGDIHFIITDAKEEIKNMEELIKMYEKKIDWLKTATCDIEERMNFLHDYLVSISDIKEEIESVNRGIGFASTLMLMIEEAEDDERYSSEFTGWGLKGDKYIYVGIECGNPNVTYDDDDGWGNVIENKAIGYKRKE